MFLGFNHFSLINKLSTNEKIGVLTLADVDNINWSQYNQQHISNLSIYNSTDSQQVIDILSYFSLSPTIKNIILKDTDPVINLILLNKYNLKQFRDLLKSKNKSFNQANGIIISGNYVYLTPEYLQERTDHQQMYEDFYAALLSAKLFNSIPLNVLTDFANNNKPYSLNTSPMVQNWGNNKLAIPIKNPNGWCQIKMDYANLICASLVYQQQSNKLSSSQINFLAKELSLKAAQEVTDLYIINSGVSDFYLAKLKLTPSSINYPFIGITNFDKNLVKDTSNNYQNITSANLTDINNLLKQQNWVFLNQTEPIKDQEFDANQSAQYYTREDPLVKQTLVLEILDTATINANCITSGIGNIYCNGKSLYKSTNYYLRIVITQENKYQ